MVPELTTFSLIIVFDEEMEKVTLIAPPCGQRWEVFKIGFNSWKKKRHTNFSWTFPSYQPPCVLLGKGWDMNAFNRINFSLEPHRRVQSCLTLCDPTDNIPPGSSVHGILQARILEWEPFPSPGIFLTPFFLVGIWLESLERPFI